MLPPSGLRACDGGGDHYAVDSWFRRAGGGGEPFSGAARRRIAPRHFLLASLVRIEGAWAVPWAAAPPEPFGDGLHAPLAHMVTTEGYLGCFECPHYTAVGVPYGRRGPGGLTVALILPRRTAHETLWALTGQAAPLGGGGAADTQRPGGGGGGGGGGSGGDGRHALAAAPADCAWARLRVGLEARRTGRLVVPRFRVPAAHDALSMLLCAGLPGLPSVLDAACAGPAGGGGGGGGGGVEGGSPVRLEHIFLGLAFHLDPSVDGGQHLPPPDWAGAGVEDEVNGVEARGGEGDRFEVRFNRPFICALWKNAGARAGGGGGGGGSDGGEGGVAEPVLAVCVIDRDRLARTPDAY